MTQDAAWGLATRLRIWSSTLPTSGRDLGIAEIELRKIYVLLQQFEGQSRFGSCGEDAN